MTRAPPAFAWPVVDGPLGVQLAGVPPRLRRGSAAAAPLDSALVQQSRRHWRRITLRTLMGLRREPDAATLAQALGIRLDAMRTRLHRLGEMGYVTSRRPPRENRVVWRVTDSGRAFVKESVDAN